MVHGVEVEDRARHVAFFSSRGSQRLPDPSPKSSALEGTDPAPRYAPDASPHTIAHCRRPPHRKGRCFAPSWPSHDKVESTIVGLHGADSSVEGLRMRCSARTDWDRSQSRLPAGIRCKCTRSTTIGVHIAIHLAQSRCTPGVKQPIVPIGLDQSSGNPMLGHPGRSAGQAGRRAGSQAGPPTSTGGKVNGIARDLQDNPHRVAIAHRAQKPCRSTRTGKQPRSVPRRTR